MEERYNWDPEVREILESGPRELAQGAMDIRRDETTEVEYVGVTQFYTPPLGIRAGLIPNIEPHENTPHTYKCWGNDDHIVYLKEH